MAEHVAPYLSSSAPPQPRLFKGFLERVGRVPQDDTDLLARLTGVLVRARDLIRRTPPTELVRPGPSQRVDLAESLANHPPTHPPAVGSIER